MSPEISIVMSCYNAAESVAESIESMLSQTFTNYEFIIIDDGSSDQTKEIVLSYQKRDSRIIFIQNEGNLGLSAALNMGIREATAPLIARMDADDISLSTRLEKQLEFLNTNPEIDILGTSVLNRKGISGTPFSKSIMPEGHTEIISRIFRKPLVMHPTILLKKEIFELYGYYDPKLRWAEDADLWYRIYDKVRWANLAEPLLIYTVKEKLTKKIIKNNLLVKYVNMKRRKVLFSEGYHLLKDALIYGYRSLAQF